MSKQQSPKEIWEIRRQQDERQLEQLQYDLERTANEVDRRTLQFRINEVKARIERNSASEVVADVEARQAEHERRQHGDPAEVAEREAAIERAREVRESEAYRRRQGQYMPM